MGRVLEPTPESAGVQPSIKSGPGPSLRHPTS